MPPRALVYLMLAAAWASACASGTPRVQVRPPAPGGEVPRPAAPGVVGDAAVARTAETLLGAPYRDGGAGPDGFDCSGLVAYVLARHGIAVPRDVKRQSTAGIPVGRDHVAPGDLVFFATTGSGPTHVGIALDGRRFIHAPKSGDVVRVDSLSAAYWAARFVTARRVSAPAPGASR